MTRYRVTNLRFSEENYRELQFLARTRGTAVAEIVREAVSLYLGHGQHGEELPFGDDPADRLVGCIADSSADASVNHDRYLYGWEKENAREAAGRYKRASRWY